MAYGTPHPPLRGTLSRRERDSPHPPQRRAVMSSGMIPITLELDLANLLIGVVESRSVPRGPADAALDAEIHASLAAPSGTETDPVKTAVRDLLRVGGYKPAGRGKPASEYLAQSAERGEF